MPYISTKLNFKLEQADELALKDEFGKAISIFPGKSERYLMLHFQDTCDMYFGGDNDDKIAMIEVKMFGMPDKAARTFNGYFLLLRRTEASLMTNAKIILPAVAKNSAAEQAG